MPYEARPYQNEALAADHSEYTKGVRRMLNLMATGTGKTITFAKIKRNSSRMLPGQMLILAHTDELVTRISTRVREENPTLKVEKEMAGEYADPDADIISASVATLGEQARRVSKDSIGMLSINLLSTRPIMRWVIRMVAFLIVLALYGVTLISSFLELLLRVSDLTEELFRTSLKKFRTSTRFDRRSLTNGSSQFEDIESPLIRNWTKYQFTGISQKVSFPERWTLKCEIAPSSEWIKLGEGRKTVVFTVDISNTPSTWPLSFEMPELKLKLYGEMIPTEPRNSCDTEMEKPLSSAIVQSSWKDTMILRFRVWWLVDLPRLLSLLPR
jgi:hypothetical protein